LVAGLVFLVVLELAEGTQVALAEGAAVLAEAEGAAGGHLLQGGAVSLYDDQLEQPVPGDAILFADLQAGGDHALGAVRDGHGGRKSQRLF
jgi:hypothetical protein